VLLFKLYWSVRAIRITDRRPNNELKHGVFYFSSWATVLQDIGYQVSKSQRKCYSLLPPALRYLLSYLSFNSVIPIGPTVVQNIRYTKTPNWALADTEQYSRSVFMSHQSPQLDAMLLDAGDDGDWSSSLAGKNQYQPGYLAHATVYRPCVINIALHLIHRHWINKRHHRRCLEWAPINYGFLRTLGIMSPDYSKL